ncbi:hypothetical protein G5B30_08570 [Sphingobacterium sp. SGG-5]|uniref:hypothetical protein n=1 Tax=Sphingobacterium sp. SGG-5 TaxID=2710881 RepID=UPI0013ECE51F|nr:hypothetical protein [Sphingobacterium sp. SGG-5]NGM61968.1 hypothetical protein [Sphingobacterium sp. SGG-5]
MNRIEITPYSTITDQSYVQDTVLSIDAASFAGVPFQGGRITFTFIGCRFRKVFIENSEDINFENISIQFVACYLEDLQVENILSQNISIHFFNSILTGRISSPNLKSVNINNCVGRSVFFLDQNRVDVSYTEENVFPKYWRKLLKDINTDFFTVINEKQSFNIYDTKIVSFKTNEANEIRKGLYKRSYESYPPYKVGYYFTEEEKALLNINLLIQYSKPVEEQTTIISGSNLNSLSLSGMTEGPLLIESTKINRWYISDFLPKGEVSLHNIYPIDDQADSKIGIHKSNLDGVWFDNIDFDKYKRISLYRSKVAKATFTSCNFPDQYSSFEKFMPIENVHYPERKTQNHHKDQYEIFLQLKRSLENTGNYYEAQKLQSIAHDALHKINSISCGDRIILKVNSLSNKHGLSIIRPFLWFIGVSVLLYILYLLSLGRIFNSNQFDHKLIGYYFSFIDLTHRNDFLVNKEEFTNWSLAVDYISKVIFGFIIYQFIAAFRKYGKK